MDTHTEERIAPPPEHGDDHDQLPTDLPRVKTWGVILAAIVVVAAFAGLFVIGYLPHLHRQREAVEQTAALGDSRPAVQVTQTRHNDKPIEIWLPADARSNQETAIFPRATGYLKRVLVDIGDKVEAGQLLAEIDMPDVDADLIQAQANVSVANANLVKAKDDFDLAQTTLQRYEGYSKAGGVTQQQLDEKRAAFTQAQSALEGANANVKATQATVQRLTATQGFEKVIAPFAGTITARNYDVGALMTATNTTDGKELYRIADTATLRVFVNVPQEYVQSIKTGQQAALVVKNFPGREFMGTVTRTAGALDPNTRTLRYEIDYDNRGGELYAGMYAQAKLQVSQQGVPLTVPTSALVFDSTGSKVWIVKDGKAFARKVDVGRDFGTEVEIAKGLSGDESVVTNPGTRLADGTEVQYKTEASASVNPGAPQPVASDSKPPQPQAIVR